MSRFHFALLNRRRFLKAAGLMAAGASLSGRLAKAWAGETVTLPFENGERELVAYPQKRPLIRLTARPPQLETPFEVFNEGLITPNDAFFVRYHLSDIEVVNDVYAGFWMSKAYRIPDNPGHSVAPGEAPKKTVPIGRFSIRSFITSVPDGAQAPVGREIVVRGIAFDGGQGIREVCFSADGGRTWRGAALGDDLGRYSFREWKIGFMPPRPGPCELMARAINHIGETQPLDPLWNPAGYMRNVVEKVRITAA